jgi:hypothetical protein
MHNPSALELLCELGNVDPHADASEFLRQRANGILQRGLPVIVIPDEHASDPVEYMRERVRELITRKGPPRGRFHGIHTTAQLRVQRVILEADGSETSRTAFKKNLILDAGLDLVATTLWANETTYCHIGTGTNPFQRDSGAITISVTTLVATASAGFFEAGDVGRLLKLDSGEEYYISAFTDTTHVDLLAGADAAASEGTIWYVNRTVLQTEVKRTATVRTSSGDNGTAYDATFRTFTHRRTHLFTAEVGAVTYQEIGWGPTNTTALFSGLVLSGGGDSLVAGQQYMVISELILTPSPTTSVASPDVGSGGWNSEGDICIESKRSASQVFSTVDANGGGGGNAVCEPSTTGSINVNDITAFLSAFTITSPMGSTNLAIPSGSVNNSYSLSSYSLGNYFREKSVTVAVATAVGTWYGVGLTSQSFRTLSVLFDTPQVKDNTHTVTVRFRFSWGRTLIN